MWVKWAKVKVRCFTFIFRRTLSVKFLRNVFVGDFWNGTEKKKRKRNTGRHKVSLNDFVVLIKLEFTCGLTRRKMVELNFLRCSGRRRASLVGFCMPGISDILDAWTGRKAFELWRRVLTTSSGQVTTAPAVPATLLGEMKTLVKLILMAAEICTKTQSTLSLQDAIVHNGLCKYLRRSAKSRERWCPNQESFKKQYFGPPWDWSNHWQRLTFMCTRAIRKFQQSSRTSFGRRDNLIHSYFPVNIHKLL